MADKNPNEIPEFLTPLPKTVCKVDLPTKGVIYDQESEAGKGSLTIAAMTMVEEGLLQAGSQGSEDVISAVLKNCIQEKISLNYMATADKFFLFMMLRALTYGSDYTFNWNCPGYFRAGPEKGNPCEAQNKTTVLIPDDFQIKYLEPEDTEPFYADLPESGKRIGFRLPRVNDEKLLQAYDLRSQEDRRRGVRRTASREAFQLALLVLSVDGNEVPKGIKPEITMRFLLSLPAKDIAIYREAVDYYTPGMDTLVKLTCETCGAVHEQDLPITVDFFRPKYSDAGRPVADEVRPDVLPRDELRDSPPDSPSGTELVLREAEGSKETRRRDRKPKARDDDKGVVSRSGSKVRISSHRRKPAAAPSDGG